MEYNSLFEPLLCICLSIILGMLIGCISMMWITAKDIAEINEELNAKNKELQVWIGKWKDKYTNDGED